MTTPAVHIRFDDNGRVYHPGETLGGQYELEAVDANQVKALELSVLWSSEGKGDEDLAVHEFVRRCVDEGDGIDPARSQRFSTQLPASPLSYDGLIVKLRWCVRVRAFLRNGKEVVGQKTFKLGDVSTVEMPVISDYAP